MISREIASARIAHTFAYADCVSKATVASIFECSPKAVDTAVRKFANVHEMDVSPRTQECVGMLTPSGGYYLRDVRRFTREQVEMLANELIHIGARMPSRVFTRKVGE